MLELKNITKVYPAGNGKVVALNGIDLAFRKSEFVAILGPSGCGKTTALNIIGGLDGYTSGDLIIGGRSTKHFKDRDWDSYRNHSIGFVFQSYNLIPHQSVLQNVELALSLSGVGRAERKRRARAALEQVGLGDQLSKRPSEMSGGQMQRVAIARAIVNEPDIILADEPTGALDTETGIQVMDILKKLSEDRLVIMVTHNPELAERYATRIIRMLDGKILGDSNPPAPEEVAIASPEEPSAKKRKREKKERKPSMSFATSFGLSLKNLFTKKSRTLLTSFAGSIGIIGIALIYAVSQGMTTYIDTVQEETLSSYPLTIEANHADLGSLLQSFIGSAESDGEHENDAVYQKSMIYDMMNALNSTEVRENDLGAFGDYIAGERAKDESESGLAEAISGVQYSYGLNLAVYTKNPEGEIIKSDSSALMQELMIQYFGMELASSMGAGSSMTGMSGVSGGMMSGMTLWQEMLPGDEGKPISELIEKQYDLVYGAWPNSYDEVVLVLDKQNELDDMTLYALGLKSAEEIDRIVDAALNGTILDAPNESWSYEEICGLEFRTILGGDCYRRDEMTGLYVDMRESETGLSYLYENGIKLKVTGIIRPYEDALSPMLTGSIGYTHMLTEYVIGRNAELPSIAAQLAAADTDIFTGLPFRESGGKLSEAEKASEFRRYIASLDEAGKAAAFIRMMGIPSAEDTAAFVEANIAPMTREDMETAMLMGMGSQSGMSESDVKGYLAAMSDEDIRTLFTAMATEQFRAQYAAGVEAQMSAMPQEQLLAALGMSMARYSDSELAVYYDEVSEFSDSSYSANLSRLGYIDIDDPIAINLYASSFENKDVIEAAIVAYNEGADELEKITYTDYVGIMMSSVTTIINAITYVLIAFVAVSLVVSSIMIGVITLISVQERTKEIGILRAIGASKKNVSGMFNAETLIVGFSSGLLGVGLTYLLCIPINMILHALTGIGNLSAYLPIPVAVLLVTISMLLTLIAGIIPSRSAAKKDPVVALRSE